MSSTDLLLRNMRPAYAEGKASPHPTEKSGEVLLRIATYNVLAKSYAQPEYFRPAQEEPMRWEGRREKLAQEIAHYRPDIICMQECDEYESWWTPAMEKLGYASVFAQRGGSKTDGSAIFYQCEKFQLQSHTKIDFNSIAEDYPEEKRADFIRHNAAVVAKLTRIADAKTFVVASTHIYWDPKMKHVKVGQAKLLKSTVRSFISESDSGVVICGDFNSTPDSDVVTTMRVKNTEGDFETSSAYALYRAEGEPEFTCCDSASPWTGTIDFLFHTSQLQPVNLLEVPTKEDVERLGEYPNSVLPSDHVILMCEFRVQ